MKTMNQVILAILSIIALPVIGFSVASYDASTDAKHAVDKHIESSDIQMGIVHDTLEEIKERLK